MPNRFPLPHLLSRLFVNKTKCQVHQYLDRKSDVNKNERDLYSVDQEAFEEHLEKSEVKESTRNQLLAWTNRLPRLKRFHSVNFVKKKTVWIVITMSLHWTLIAGFLYAEIAVVLILLIPFISNKTWRKLFKSRFLKGIENQFIYYFYILVAILVLFFLGE